MLKNNGTLPSQELIFNCSSDGCNLDNSTSLTEYNLEGLEQLDYKGTKAKSGTVKIGSNGNNITVTNLNINGFNCNYIGDIASCEKGESGTNPTPSLTRPTSELPTGDGYTGVKAIVYLDPTDLNKKCDASNINSDIGTKTGCMKWYAYVDDGTNYTMILDHNTTYQVAWSIDMSPLSRIPVTANAQLASDTEEWNSSLNPRLITADEVAQIVGKTSWNSSTATDGFTFDKNYVWLCDPFFWTSSFANSSSSPAQPRAWAVLDIKVAYEFKLKDSYGVRPAITVNKSYIS